jgi:hypothetical protein
MSKYSIESTDGTLDNVFIVDNDSGNRVDGVVDASIQFHVEYETELTFTIKTTDFNIALKRYDTPSGADGF